MIPSEYVDREHTFLKHQILKLYLESWSNKIYSIARSQKQIKLFYVDCFSGPWNSGNDNNYDTSIYLSLNALNQTLEFWKSRGLDIEAAAIFIEKDENSFVELLKLTEREKKNVKVYAFNGLFGDYVEKINSIIHDCPTLLFVDPKGWKGASMKYIAPLTDARFRDVIINVMFDHINRFKDSELQFISKQMEEFFEEELAPDLSEEQLMSVYRRNLKLKCKLKYSADLIIPYPTKNRTKYRLVVGGNHPEVIKLFRTIEQKVTGDIAASLKVETKERLTFEKTGQYKMELGEGKDETPYSEVRQIGMYHASNQIKQRIELLQEVQVGFLWPEILEAHHITHNDFNSLIFDLIKTRFITISNKKKTERSLKDYHILQIVKNNLSNGA